MCKLIYTTLFVLLVLHAEAQVKPSGAWSPSAAELEKLKKMTPAERDTYKDKMLKQYSASARDIADKNKLPLDEMQLPDYKIQMPPKDLRRLALIPKQPPTLIQLSDGLRASKKQLEAMAPKAVVEEVKQVAATHTPEDQHTAAIADFYANKPEQAILKSMNAVLENPAEMMGWNNLAAMMNMTGLEHKAVPILMHHLQKDPANSMLLNNMGQAYLGLGDVSVAELFLKKCLENDPMHPEANRSMGMIKFFYEQYEEGMQYFERELEMAYRGSTMALLKSKNKALNLFRLRKKRPDMPGHNYFDELQLSGFNMPSLPEKTDHSAQALNEFRDFGASVQAEMLYWSNKAFLSEEEIKADGKKHHGLYFDLVQALLSDLNDLYKPEELSLFNELDINHLEGLMKNYNERLLAVKCPQAPAGVTHEEYTAYIKKCCDLKKPVMDAFVSQYNAFVTKCAKRTNGMWREYITDLINIVSLDPSAANRALVYKQLSNYFTFLSSTGMGQFIDPPPGCTITLTAAQADSLIVSSRRLDLKCPQALNFELDMTLFKAKADCNKYAVEGGKLFQLGYEYAFKTGTTTLMAGVGAKAKFTKIPGSAEIKQLMYLSFDGKGFSDFGLLGKASAKIGDNPIKVGPKIGEQQDKFGGTYIGIEGGYTLGINSGWKGYVKGTGVLADFVKIN